MLQKLRRAAGSHCGSHFFFIKSESFGTLFEASIDSPTLFDKASYLIGLPNLRLLYFPHSMTSVLVELCFISPLWVFVSLSRFSVKFTLLNHLKLKHMCVFSGHLAFYLSCSIKTDMMQLMSLSLL